MATDSIGCKQWSVRTVRELSVKCGLVGWRFLSRDVFPGSGGRHTECGLLRCRPLTLLTDYAIEMDAHVGHRFYWLQTMGCADRS